MGITKDIKVGDRFGKLVVTKIIPYHDKIGKQVECLCEECGGYKILRPEHIIERKTLTCGCDKNERVNENNIQEYIGRKYNHLTIIGSVPREIKDGKKGRFKVECLCDCGNKHIATFKAIRNGTIKSCGCEIVKNIERKERYNKKYIGKKYGKLTIIDITFSSKSIPIAHCKCDCGKDHDANLYDVLFGSIKSCGCYRTEKTIERSTKHGDAKERLYGIYLGMKGRCYNPNYDSYKYYGGRGIKVCDEWLENYLNFKSWALDNGYTEKLTIDRIDVNSDYKPSNCRWATLEEQANNKTDNAYIEYNGKSQTLRQWCNELDLDYKLIVERFHQPCWKDKSIEEKFFTPKRVAHTLTYNNETHTLKEWSEIREIPYPTISQRHRRGYSVEDILCKGTIPRSHKPLQSTNKI
jgi:hypothetical protein